MPISSGIQSVFILFFSSLGLRNWRITGRGARRKGKRQSPNRTNRKLDSHSMENGERICGAFFLFSSITIVNTYTSLQLQTMDKSLIVHSDKYWLANSLITGAKIGPS